LQPLKISRNFVYRAIKLYKEFWGVKTSVGQDARKVLGLKPLSKEYGSGFVELRSGNRGSGSES
jgi:hypothetical protein